MKRVLGITVVIFMTLAPLVIAIYMAHFYYWRYKTVVTSTEERLEHFDQRLSVLEAHKSRELTPTRFSGVISTLDRPEDKFIGPTLLSGRHPGFELAAGKGDWIVPEFRIPTGLTSNLVYDIHVADHLGTVADAWLSHAAPYTDLASFEEFRVYHPNSTNMLRLIVRPKAGASVQMRFDIVVLTEK